MFGGLHKILCELTHVLRFCYLAKLIVGFFLPSPLVNSLLISSGTIPKLSIPKSFILPSIFIQDYPLILIGEVVLLNFPSSPSSLPLFLWWCFPKRKKKFLLSFQGELLNPSSNFCLLLAAPLITLSQLHVLIFIQLFLPP